MNITYTEIETKVHGHFRFMVIAWCCALPIMYTLLIWLTMLCDVADRQWLAIAIAPIVGAGMMLGSMWACIRITLANAQKRFSTNDGLSTCPIVADS